MSGWNWKHILEIAISLAVVALIGWILIRINHRTFRKIQEKKNGLHLIFFERLVTVVILIGCVILAFSVFGGIGAVWKTMLGGTAIISAVLAFAAQDVIKDLLAGLMISIHKPFEVGNRIELEDGTAGVVIDMTTRQVVLRGTESLCIIVPNSKIAAMKIRNFSWQREGKAAYFRFSVGYGSDMKLVKELIAAAVKESPLTVPGLTARDGSPAYSPVRFMEFADSALTVTVMVYFGSNVSTEDVTDDINMRVREALTANGVEIPYNYMNVVISGQEPGNPS